MAKKKSIFKNKKQSVKVRNGGNHTKSSGRSKMGEEEEHQ